MTYSIVCLGRIGDILNALPLAYHLSRKGTVQFVVSKEFSNILERATYVTPIIWDGDYDKVHKCLQWLKKQGIKAPIIAQTHGYFGNQVGKNYQKGAWVAAGYSNLFGSEPLVLEHKKDFVVEHPRPVVGVCMNSISSPFLKGDDIWKALCKCDPDIYPVNFDNIKEENAVDMIDWYHRMDAIISVDTMHLHLCRAAEVPVIAITNDGWKGSVQPPNTIANFRYADVTPEKVVQAVKDLIETKQKKRNIYIVSDIFGTTERHFRARKTWTELPDVEIVKNAASMGPYQRCLNDDSRKLPFLKDLLFSKDWNDDDIILWVNDDCALDPKILSWCKNHVAVFGAATMRRNEGGHVGRDLAGFTGKWLKTNRDAIPDYVIGEEQFDMGLAALIRKQRGISSTLQNMKLDFYPCETKDRFCLHEPHAGDWTNTKYQDSTPKKHNRKLFAQWFAKNQSHLKFS